jgi:hypothetical protein
MVNLSDLMNRQVSSSGFARTSAAIDSNIMMQTSAAKQHKKTPTMPVGVL